MNNLYLCTHFGFGDYVICYGLVKELSKRYDIIFLFAINHRSPLHIDNIKRLYSSIENVQIITDDPRKYEDVFYLGWDKFTEYVKKDKITPFAKFFYDQAGVPLNLLWDNFYFERDIKKEQEIYDKLNINEPYIFLHDDPVRGFVINRKYITQGIRIIHFVELENISILDSLYLVEKALEVHITTTGLASFIDQMNIKHSSLNLHKYVRPLPYDQPILKLNWNIYE